MDNPKRYNTLEKHLQHVSATYITIPRHVRLKTNQKLKKILNVLIQKMKKNDKLFDLMYKEPFFTGSFYEGLKVGSSDEYDIDLLLEFPSTGDIEIRQSNVPGFVNLYLKNKKGFENFYQVDDKRQLFLDTEKLLSWMEGIIQKTFNEFNTDGLWYILGKNRVKYCKSGPAFTLTVKGVIDNQQDTNIDLVPCFMFGGDKWPNGFRLENTNNLYEFFVVPKHPKSPTCNASIHWRLSFNKQEKRLINDMGFLKPALRLVKKLRDAQQQHKMYSYFLKTIVLWDVEKYPPTFWRKNSFSYIFMHILKRYQECLENEELRYFWNEKFNLLETVQADFRNMSNRLLYIINKVDNNISDDPSIIQQYLITPAEQSALKRKYGY